MRNKTQRSFSISRFLLMALLLTVSSNVVFAQLADKSFSVKPTTLKAGQNLLFQDADMKLYATKTGNTVTYSVVDKDGMAVPVEMTMAATPGGGTTTINMPMMCFGYKCILYSSKTGKCIKYKFTEIACKLAIQ